jgi:membrane-bound lytic murein transglycosylase D
LSNANQQILLPFAHAEIFQANLKSYNKPLSTWTAVKIVKTESVDQVGKTLGVDVDTLRSVNGIPKGMRIKAGSTILIPKTSSRAGDVSTAMAENASLSLVKPAPSAPKCDKSAKTGQNAKCVSSKPAAKGNSSPKNTTSQHKSASTGLAKSAKNTVSASSSSKGGANSQ